MLAARADVGDSLLEALLLHDVPALKKQLAGPRSTFSHAERINGIYLLPRCHSLAYLRGVQFNRMRQAAD